MNILQLEDEGLISIPCRKYLESSKHVVFEAENIDEADEYWSEQMIECIVLDLHVSPKGLIEDEQRDPLANHFAGWVWLRDHVLRLQPEMRERTIVYSAFINDFEKAVPAEERAGLRFVPKSDVGPQALLKAIIAIESLARRQPTP